MGGWYTMGPGDDPAPEATSRDPAAVPSDPTHHEPYRAIGTRARWTVGFLALIIAVDAVSIWSGARERSLLLDIQAGRPAPESTLDASDLRQVLVASAQVVALTLAAVAFIAWLYRAYSNLPALGSPELRFGRRWAIWAWFVPFLNLWRPKQIANDIWRASEPESPREHGSSWVDPVPRFLTVWWIVWIASGVLDQQLARQVLRADTTEALLSANSLGMLTDVVGIVAAVLAIVVVRWTTARQEGRASRFEIAPVPQEKPLMRRQATYLAMGGFVLALALQALVAIGAAGIAVSVSTSPPVGSSSSPPANGLLFTDAFEDSASGWYVGSDEQSTMGYEEGTYQIAIAVKEYMQWSQRQLLNVKGNLSLKADGWLHEGSTEDSYGLACLTEVDMYSALVDSDGYYSISRANSDGSGGEDVLESGQADSSVIGGKGRRNALRLDCIQAGQNPGTFRLWVNDVRIAIGVDPNWRSGTSFATFALVSGSWSGTSDARFDNFELHAIDE